MTKYNKITLTKIARDAGISPQSLTNIIKKRRGPSWETSKRLARATGISVVAWMEGLVDREYLDEKYNPRFQEEENRAVQIVE